MDSTELYEHFRSEVFDTKKPYLWSDEEMKRYGADAHRMFVRLIGGIADFTSDACRVQVTANEPTAEIHPSVLRIMSAYRASDKHPVEVLNQTDIIAAHSQADYGRLAVNVNDPQPGFVSHMIIGAQRNTAKFAVLPVADDEIIMSIYRLPLEVISDEGQEISEVDEEHHIHLVMWMKALAFRKHDVETYDSDKAREYDGLFRSYCSQVKAEQERKKHKTRVVQYGGI